MFSILKHTASSFSSSFSSSLRVLKTSLSSFDTPPFFSHPSRLFVTMSSSSPSTPTSAEHLTYIRHVLAMKNDLYDRPRQTGFRVMALITYHPKSPPSSSSSSTTESSHPYHQHLRHSEYPDHAYVLGTNTELCFIGSGICAERTALLQLRMKHYESLRSLYIITDSTEIISPGLLCREFLVEFLPPKAPIVLACEDSQQPHGFRIDMTDIETLYPYPSIYNHIPVSQLLQYAQQFSQKTAQSFAQQYQDKQPNYLTLYQEIVALAQIPNRAALHPLNYAAGVIFSDGTTKTTKMTKLLEFGWSLDPIVKLIATMEEKQSTVKPVAILITDQFGILHAPVAPARAHLAEGGHGGHLIFHDRDGKLVETDVKKLTPATPDAIADILTTTAKLAQ